jgi:hypothetical protein
MLGSEHAQPLLHLLFEVPYGDGGHGKKLRIASIAVNAGNVWFRGTPSTSSTPPRLSAASRNPASAARAEGRGCLSMGSWCRRGGCNGDKSLISRKSVSVCAIVFHPVGRFCVTRGSRSHRIPSGRSPHYPVGISPHPFHPPRDDSETDHL